ncbi:hypothetical protein [Marinibactrum halimedae]|uniref:Uncharacterized protein n=1 Tax=Marinibactrum halimedae TaxID=1444977 RepID=A0AA37WKR0_9GAMM|nr:hypothetical protein [Marinibactrum halimedae]MCD9461100.1 hypothetical protein [Marinibactrum halimedae]GLS24440.1 hypothetical protein GCM10007877_01510 [Marinibactrum halimedae]
MNKFVSVLFLIFCFQPSFASQQNSVQLVSLNVNRQANQVFLRTDIAPVENGCHTDLNWNYTFRLETFADQALYSTLLAAKVANLKVTLVGFGGCPSYGGAIEELRWVTVINQS